MNAARKHWIIYHSVRPSPLSGDLLDEELFPRLKIPRAFLRDPAKCRAFARQHAPAIATYFLITTAENPGARTGNIPVAGPFQLAGAKSCQ